MSPSGKGTSHETFTDHNRGMAQLCDDLTWAYVDDEDGTAPIPNAGMVFTVNTNLGPLVVLPAHRDVRFRFTHWTGMGGNV